MALASRSLLANTPATVRNPRVIMRQILIFTDLRIYDGAGDIQEYVDHLLAIPPWIHD